MTHYGSLGNRRIPGAVSDIRGTTVRDADGENLGTVQDVIIDHDTMEIQSLIVDAGDWLEAQTFLLPANRIAGDEDHEDGLTAVVSKQQIRDSPRYDNKSRPSEDEWKKYEQAFREYWDEEPVMHMKDSYRIITPPEVHAPGQASASGQGGVKSAVRESNAAQLFPQRISDVFSDPAPSGGKVTLRPKPVARAEEAARGVTLLKPQWWEAFENYLQLNKDDIQAKCSHCAKEAA